MSTLNHQQAVNRRSSREEGRYRCITYCSSTRTPEERAKHHDPAQVEAYFAGWNAFIGTLAQSGAMVSGNGLLPPDTATTLRITNGTRQVLDGPFAEHKEMLGGYVILDVPDLDAALDWAARVPCVTAGSVEIRPILPPPGA